MPRTFADILDNLEGPGRDFSSVLDGLEAPAPGGWEDVTPMLQRRRKASGKGYDYRPKPGAIPGGLPAVGKVATPDTSAGAIAREGLHLARDAVVENVTSVPEQVETLLNVPRVAVRRAARGRSVNDREALGELLEEPRATADTPLRQVSRDRYERAVDRFAGATQDLPTPIAAGLYGGIELAAGLADPTNLPAGGAVSRGIARGGAEALAMGLETAGRRTVRKAMGESGGAALAREAASGRVDELAEEAAYLARRERAMRELPGADDRFVQPGSVTEAFRPEGEILGVGRQASRESQDATLGLRAPREEAEELARTSLDIAEDSTPVGGFRTAKGSEYALFPDGTTVRNKAPRPEHPGDYGVKPRSRATVYVTPGDAQKLGEVQLASGPRRQIVILGDHAGVGYLSGPDAGKIEQRTFVPIRKEPTVGLQPIEVWEGGKSHFGNTITELDSPNVPDLPERVGERGSIATSPLSSARDWVVRNFKGGGPQTGQYELAAREFEPGRGGVARALGRGETPAAGVVRSVPKRIERLEGAQAKATQRAQDIIDEATPRVREIASTKKGQQALWRDMQAAAAGDLPIKDIPEPLRPFVSRRQQLTEALQKRGIATGAFPDDMVEAISKSGGKYHHRTYRAFKDPKHYEKVVDTPDWYAARDYLAQELRTPRRGMEVSLPDGRRGVVERFGVSAEEAMQEVARTRPEISAEAAGQWDKWRRGETVVRTRDGQMLALAKDRLRAAKPDPELKPGIAILLPDGRSGEVRSFGLSPVEAGREAARSPQVSQAAAAHWDAWRQGQLSRQQLDNLRHELIRGEAARLQNQRAGQVLMRLADGGEEWVSGKGLRGLTSDPRALRQGAEVVLPGGGLGRVETEPLTFQRLRELRRERIEPEISRVRAERAGEARIRLADGSEARVVRDQVRGVTTDGEIQDILLALTKRERGTTALTIQQAPTRLNAILRERKNIPPPLRKLMGEELDFRLTTLETIEQLARDIETHNFWKELGEDGLAAGVFREAGSPPAGGLYAEGGLFRRIPGSNKVEGVSSRGPVEGLLTREALRDALVGQFEPRKVTGWNRFAAYVNLGKTVGSFPAGHVRNFMAHHVTSAVNGKSPVLVYQKAAELRRLFKDPAMRSLRDRAVELGVVGDGASSREVFDFIQMIEEGTANPLAVGTAKAGKKLGESWRAGDHAWRAAHWLDETEQLAWANPGMSRPAVEAWAADRVLDTFQTYSRAPEIAARLRRTPFGGPGVTFHMESVRNVKNIARTAASDIATGIKTSNPRMVALGMRRVAGLMAGPVAVASLPALSRLASGSDRRQQEAMRRQVLPYYLENAEVFTYDFQLGKSVSVIDLSFMNPYSSLSGSAIATYRSMGEANGVPPAAAIGEFLDQITGGDIATKELLQLVTNESMGSPWELGDRKGSPIYNLDEAPRGVAAAKDAGYHAYRGFAPGGVVQGENLLRGAGILDNEGQAGRVRSLPEEGIATFGVRPSTYDIPKSFRFNLAKKGDRFEEVTREFRKAIPTDPEKLARQADRCLDSWSALYEETKQAVGDYRLLGMDAQAIRSGGAAVRLPGGVLKSALAGNDAPPSPIRLNARGELPESWNSPERRPLALAILRRWRERW